MIKILFKLLILLNIIAHLVVSSRSDENAKTLKKTEDDYKGPVLHPLRTKPYTKYNFKA